MTDSMKFGPEWLRNMGQDGCTAPPPMSAPTPRYQLAEHRYGREEMLALFDMQVKAPDPLSTFPGLFVDKTQVPLALIQMTEEETRHWNRGINSDAVLRATGKPPSVTLTTSIRGSRGGTVGPVTLGRGRGRGGFTTYNRGLSYEEGGDSPTGPPHGHLGAPPGGYTRGTRPFDRSQSDRSWSERNGLDTSAEWTATSPRKDFNDRTLGGPSPGRTFTTDSNWRRSRAGEEEDGWRASGTTPEKGKWGGAGASGAARTTSWRDGDRDREREGELAEGRGGYNRAHRPWDHSSNLPEWAVDGADNSSGSFDAQGAFHGGHTYSDEEENGGTVNNSVLRRTRLLSEGNSSGPGKRDGNSNANHRRVVATDRASAERVSEKLTPYLDKQNDVRVPSPSTPPRSEEFKDQESTPIKPVQNSKSDPDLKSKESPSPQAAPPAKSKLKTPPHPSELPNPLTTSASMPAISVPNNIHQENHVDTRQHILREHKSEDAMERMGVVAHDLVAKLMEEEEGPIRDDLGHHHHHSHMGTHVREPEKWFYRDPQGQVQGPFSSEEMAEWFRLGYFNLNLLVRRAKDERFSQLQDLIKVFGGIPFMTEANVPPVKGADPLLMGNPGVGIPMGPGMPKMPMVGIPGMQGIPGVPGVAGVPGVPGIPGEPDIMMMQHQYQVLQQQMFLRQQSQAAAAAAVSKLQQTEGWNTLSPIQQQELVSQHIQMNAHMATMDAGPPILPNASAPSSVMALMSQFQQKSQQQQQPRMPQAKDVPGPQPGQPLDPLQQLIQQMGGLSSRLSPPPSPAQAQQPSNDQLPSDPIQSLLRQLNQQQQQQQQQQHQQVAHHQAAGDSLWGSPLPVYNHGSWLGGVRPPLVGGSVPPSGPMLPPSTASLWGDLNTKEMKTEKQILEEQMLIEEDRKKQQELLRKQEEEEQRRREEEIRARQEAEEANALAVAAEAEKQKKKAEEAKRKEEEARRKEDQRKAEEDRKKQEEAKRQEIARKKEEDKKKKEEDKRRKEEEKERKRREEEEKKRQEEERQQRAREAEEQAKRTEQQRQQAEALRKMQEQQQKQAQAAAAIKTAKVAPWSQPQAAKLNSQPASLSLAEIQRNQKREKEEQLREQQLILQQIQQQNHQNQLSAMLASSLAAAENQAQPAQMQLKWAERKAPPLPEAKTMEQIQREEQERIAKQLERDRAERAERAAAARDVPAPSVGIWGSAPQSLTWGNTSSGPGFWDEVASPAVSPVKPAAQAMKKGTPVKSASASNVPASAQQGAKSANNSAKKKKEEATVLKLFEQTVQRTDEFSQWCHKALASLQPSVDIPTFVGFLRDIESPYEVKDYVRQYLGEGEGSNDFARQFLERRSKWRSERRSKPAADDMCAPAPAVNPVSQQASHDFQEVKGKGKKTKKGKMFKVDQSILGFSVTAAPDRINVGDRDYGEGI
ncbi:GRB10-interacting GYF protein 2 [Frankliniella occidentalis]|uniref:GRB10-interacting GYF protein 2 n=1 Tax=Frankliniella occidentalis TaxID=133901 RepID=A0A6J1SHK5_FRAOC|nr:GRB10-interacting GYF protein 2 [Frankliniella occidentalis]XP_052126953.1 GRB10-interacting GYF protein 2 [Frankliniella occidentalis]XP_052126954.1 GRB10-interacting GYF protein 2 [Frankliniella occidentalis]